MLIKFLQKVFFGYLILLIQLSIVPALGWPLNLLNPILIFLVFIYILTGLRETFYYAIGFGLVLDLYHSYFFGLELCLLVVTWWLLDKVYIKLLTNKSLYAMSSLLVIGLLIETILYRSLTFAYSFFVGENLGMSWSIVGSGIVTVLQMFIVNVAAAAVVFGLFYYLSNKFHSVIIRK